MFIKSIVKTDKDTAKKYQYYRLCESFRIGNKTRHRSILSLGKLEEIPSEMDRKILADRIEHLFNNTPGLLTIRCRQWLKNSPWNLVACYAARLLKRSLSCSKPIHLVEARVIMSALIQKLSVTKMYAKWALNGCVSKLLISWILGVF